MIILDKGEPHKAIDFTLTWEGIEFSGYSITEDIQISSSLKDEHEGLVDESFANKNIKA